MPNTPALGFNWVHWSHLAVWLAAGAGALAAASVVATLVRGRFSPPPREAVLVIGAVVVTSYIDVDFGAWLALTLGACPLLLGAIEYLRGRAIESRARLHTSPEEWAAHFAMNGTCPCADASVKRSGERSGGMPALAGRSTSTPEPVESASRSGCALGVDAGRPEDTRPVAVGERRGAVPLPVAAPAARHHVSDSEPDVVARLGGDVVPHPRFKTSGPAGCVDKSPTFHVAGSVAALAEAG